MPPESSSNYKAVYVESVDAGCTDHNHLGPCEMKLGSLEFQEALHSENNVNNERKLEKNSENEENNVKDNPCRRVFRNQPQLALLFFTACSANVSLLNYPFALHISSPTTKHVSTRAKCQPPSNLSGGDTRRKCLQMSTASRRCPEFQVRR